MYWPMLILKWSVPLRRVQRGVGWSGNELATLRMSKASLICQLQLSSVWLWNIFFWSRADRVVDGEVHEISVNSASYTIDCVPIMKSSEGVSGEAGPNCSGLFPLPWGSGSYSNLGSWFGREFTKKWASCAKFSKLSHSHCGISIVILLNCSHMGQ